MKFFSRNSIPLPTQREVMIWTLVEIMYPLLSEPLFNPQKLPHLTHRHLVIHILISMHVFYFFITFPLDLGSLFDAHLASPAHGSEDWRESGLYSMMSRLYWALNSGDPKGTIRNYKHGCNSWKIMRNWLSPLNQAKVMAHIKEGEAHLVGILIS
jgi:hypothetical protein